MNSSRKIVKLILLNIFKKDVLFEGVNFFPSKSCYFSKGIVLDISLNREVILDITCSVRSFK